MEYLDYNGVQMLRTIELLLFYDNVLIGEFDNHVQIANHLGFIIRKTDNEIVILRDGVCVSSFEPHLNPVEVFVDWSKYDMEDYLDGYKILYF